VVHEPWNRKLVPLPGYLNGIDQGAPDTSGGTGSGGFPAGLDSLAIGGSGGGATPNNGVHARFADFAVFNSDPGQAGATALASGQYNPAQIDLANLVFYAPLHNWDDPDLMGAGTPSWQGTQFGTDIHPPIQQAIIPIRHTMTYPNDKLFTLAYVAPDTPGMYATTTMDPALGFLEKDAANHPSANAGGAMVSCVGGVHSREIGVVYIGDASGDDPYFSLFNMDTQTWSETDDQIFAASESNENVGIVWRPTAQEYVSAWNGDLVSTYHVPYWSRRTGVSTWSAPVALYTGTPAGDCYLAGMVQGANDLVHFLLMYDDDLYIRTLKADNTLTPWPAVPFADSGGNSWESVAATIRWDVND